MAGRWWRSTGGFESGWWWALGGAAAQTPDSEGGGLRWKKDGEIWGAPPASLLPPGTKALLAEGALAGVALGGHSLEAHPSCSCTDGRLRGGDWLPPQRVPGARRPWCSPWGPVVARRCAPPIRHLVAFQIRRCFFGCADLLNMLSPMDVLCWSLYCLQSNRHSILGSKYRTEASGNKNEVESKEQDPARWEIKCRHGGEARFPAADACSSGPRCLPCSY